MLLPTGLTTLLCTAQLAAAAPNATARQNWPQWRGPLANGVAPEADPPREWSESKIVKWKVPIPGEGSSTPAIWGERIFVLTAFSPEKKAEASPAPEARRDGPPPGPGGPGGRKRPGGSGGGFGGG